MKHSTGTSVASRAFMKTSHLIGRSRAERELDLLYHKQSKLLPTTQSVVSRRHATPNSQSEIHALKKQKTDNIHGPKNSTEVSNLTKNNTNSEYVTCSKDKNRGSQKRVEEALHDLVKKHINSAQKFPRAVELIRKLSAQYLNKDNKFYFLKSFEAVTFSDSAISTSEGRSEVMKLFEVLECYKIPTNNCNGNNCNEIAVVHNQTTVSYKNDCSNYKGNNDVNKTICNTNRLSSREHTSYEDGKHVEKCIIENQQEASIYNSQNNRHYDKDTESINHILDTETNSRVATGCDQYHLSMEPDDNLNQVLFDKEEIEFLNILRIRAVFHNRLFTDDAFQFNKSIAYFKNLFHTIVQEYSEGHNSEHEKASTTENTDPPLENAQIEQSSTTRELIQVNVSGKHVQQNEIVDYSHTSIDEIKCNNFEEEKDDTVPNNQYHVNTDSFGSNDDIFTWKIMNRKRQLDLKLLLFFDALKTIFSMRNTMWARSSVEFLFQNVYINRYVFPIDQQNQVSYWQSELKTKQRNNKTFDVYRIGESANPVKDGREERIITTHGSMIWSAKQTGL